MNTLEAIEARHSVRSYTDEPLSDQDIQALNDVIAACNAEGDLHLQLVVDEPRAFSTGRARYGSFKGVRNYIVCAGKNAPDLQERCGYYGERVVLEAQCLGLNTCWVGLTFQKIPEAFQLAAGEKLVCVISLGHGTTQGGPHKIKTAGQVSDCSEDSPAWYKAGIRAALLAPTALNQQKFSFARKGDIVSTKPGLGFFSKVDLGIARYHFEVAAGKEHFRWANQVPAQELSGNYVEIK